jgi:hypothetical protein
MVISTSSSPGPSSRTAFQLKFFLARMSQCRFCPSRASGTKLAAEKKFRSTMANDSSGTWLHNSAAYDTSPVP